MKVAAILQTYKRYAKIYDVLFGKVLNDGRNKIVSFVEGIPHNNILEIGVGTGLLMMRYPSSSRITGVDISVDMLKVAEKRVQESGQDNRIELKCGSFEQMNELSPNSYDCVSIPYVLSVTSTPVDMLEKALFCCKPSGYVVIVNHFSGAKGWAIIERIAAPFADFLGFESKFDYETYIGPYSHLVIINESANIMGLSRFVVLQKK
jgi:phosphatidylethanolamine/phosphatidyl-N-methylethanolamine N-methyltransferase